MLFREEQVRHNLLIRAGQWRVSNHSAGAPYTACVAHACNIMGRSRRPGGEPDRAGGSQHDTRLGKPSRQIGYAVLINGRSEIPQRQALSSGGGSSLGMKQEHKQDSRLRRITRSKSG